SLVRCDSAAPGQTGTETYAASRRPWDSPARWSASEFGGVAILSRRPSRPQSAQEKAGCDVVTRSKIAPPGATRTASDPTAFAAQTAPSLSAQIPSGTTAAGSFESVAQGRRLLSVPSFDKSNAVNPGMKHSATTSV